ncbi:MAG: S41 family peptidase [Bacteroidales bacterium]
MRKFKTILFASLLILGISCEKLFIEADPENLPENNFELLWSEIDENYSFFEFKNINWDSIYHEYKAEVHNNMGNTRLFELMTDMLHELRDGHVNLYSELTHSRSYEWYANYSMNFNFSNIQNNYLGNDYDSTGPFLTKIIDSVGYIYFGSLSDDFSEKDIDTVIEHFSGLRGIIFDVRNNSGGLSKTGKITSSRFADRKRLVSYTLYKTGPEHNDFSDPQPNYVRPGGKVQFLKPVAVLSNRRTYSAANDFVLSMSAFPHVTIIGDVTGGGGGTPYDYELPNGWRCRFPRTQTLAANGFNIEHGISPDIRVYLSKSDEDNGLDTIIETAVKFISLQNEQLNQVE